VFSVGCDKAARMLDLQTNQTVQVGAHDAPIQCCRYIDGLPSLNNILVTGSWDKTAKVSNVLIAVLGFEITNTSSYINIAGKMLYNGCERAFNGYWHSRKTYINLRFK
jgi:WD40 repeat protein